VRRQLRQSQNLVLFLNIFFLSTESAFYAFFEILREFPPCFWDFSKGEDCKFYIFSTEIDIFLTDILFSIFTDVLSFDRR